MRIAIKIRLPFLFWKTKVMLHHVQKLFSAVEPERNKQRRSITWQFTPRDAHRKLERLYPVKVPH